MRQYAKKTAAEVEAHRRFLAKDFALRSVLAEPLLRTVTAEAQAAAAERAALHRKAFKERGKTAKPPKVVPELIFTQPGAQQAFPPYDDAWTDPNSSSTGLVLPDPQTGVIATGLAANGSQYGAGGLGLAIFPASASDSLIIMPQMVFTGTYGANSYAFGSASLAGYGEILVYAFDAEGNWLPEFDQQQEFQFISASAWGFEQGANGDVNIPPQFPLVQVQNGAQYVLWMILRNFADAGGNGQADSDLAVTVPTVIIVEQA